MGSSKCTWCQKATWKFECDSCARPHGVLAAVRHCQSCSEAWHAVGASRLHVRREAPTTKIAATSVEDALEVQIQEKMLLLQQTLDTPQGTQESTSTDVVPTADQPFAVDSSETNSLGLDVAATSHSTDVSVSQNCRNGDMKENDSASSTTSGNFPGDDNGPEIIVINDDDDDDSPEDAATADVDEEWSQLEPLDPALVDQLLAMCTIQDAVNCVHFTQCRDSACVAASQHQVHVTCPDQSAMCRAFGMLTQHCETCPTAATCAVCVLVLQRRLQYKYVALCQALSVLPATAPSSPVAVTQFQAYARQSLKIRKQTCELELKDTVDTIRRLRLPTTTLPPIQNHFHRVTIPKWKRMRDPISDLMFAGTDTEKWRKWVQEGLHIVQAMECKYKKYCRRECATWVQAIQTYTTMHKLDPSKVTSTPEGEAIARHLSHYPCKFRQCMYCTLSTSQATCMMVNDDHA
ncbi:hypothetical protein, variant 1 [Aphanomyces astaci]|uniref:TAZ-type domain-containing protein n=1 Tax=Aphanomyces astaci TaxID=112090 RepID=W4FYK5_APHAT|nr:hypothetical protein, variant 1 [Aphanomyces astaci]ETV72056.1 hypothetical protein, variant 1 [Aphanomyces astaci]|eukprot:XP_009838499.1 hypothetical protein, variant 1 [Aphanomyces astaci]